MTVKLIEIRDRGTFIAAMAIKLFARDEAERFLLGRAGYAKEQITGLTIGVELVCPVCGYTLGAELAEPFMLKNPNGVACPNKQHDAWLGKRPGIKAYDGQPYILLVKLDGVDAEYDPFQWTIGTMPTAHRWLIAHWDEVRSGDVVDVEFLLGQSSAPKVSERAL